GLQQPKPFALDIGAEAEQLDLVLAHIGFDRQYRRFTRRRQCLQCTCRTVHLIADALHGEDHVILDVGIDQAFELADYRLASLSVRAMLWRGWAWMIAMASASA